MPAGSRRYHENKVHVSGAIRDWKLFPEWNHWNSTMGKLVWRTNTFARALQPELQSIRLSGRGELLHFIRGKLLVSAVHMVTWKDVPLAAVRLADWHSNCSITCGGDKPMFQRGDAVIYFEHKATGEVRQHFGHILSVGQSGTYQVRFQDLPVMSLFFAYLRRAM